MSIEEGNIFDPEDYDESDSHYKRICDDCGNYTPCKCEIADRLRDEANDN